jgi:hypothetical protein
VKVGFTVRPFVDLLLDCRRRRRVWCRGEVLVVLSLPVDIVSAYSYSNPA